MPSKPGSLLLSEAANVSQASIASLVGQRAALTLQKTHFASLRYGTLQEGRLWVRLRLPRTAQSIGITVDQLRRELRTMRALGIILAKNCNHTAFDRTLSYAIDYERLQVLMNSIVQICTMDYSNLHNPFGKSAQSLLRVGEEVEKIRGAAPAAERNAAPAPPAAPQVNRPVPDPEDVPPAPRESHGPDEGVPMPADVRELLSGIISRAAFPPE